MRLRALREVGSVFDVLGHRAGRYYLGPVHVTIASTYVVAVDTLLGQPFLVPKRHTYDRIALHVDTAEAGVSVRLGIYRHDALNVVPAGLILDAGTVSLATTGKKELVIAETLNPGWYWLATLSDATGTARLTAARNANAGDPLLGYDDADATDHYRHVTRTQSYGVLPDPFGAIGAYGPGETPRVWLRA